MNVADQYEVVIGLEVHAQLLTQTKLFCADTTHFGVPANTQVSPVSLGHPGTLPKMNREAITLAVKLGLACHCEIVQYNYFARKNYFYPDLPKGYQISQHTTPICRKGYLEITAGGTRNIRINRIHMEEDAGKSMHDPASIFSNLDYNRAGMPLVEIVTEPDIATAEEAAAYVTELRRLVRHLGVCDGNMEQGSLRCDVNISVRLKGDQELGTKVEIKNLNSIRFIRKSIEHEKSRLIALHQRGETILQQTRGFDEETGTTYAIRTKEDEDDYRYFPEPDLPPFILSDEFIQSVKASMPPAPAEQKKELVTSFGLSEYDASQLAQDSSLLHYFRSLASLTKNYKAAANWTIGPVKNWMQAEDSEDFPVQPARIAQLIGLIDEGKINFGIAGQKVLPQLINNPETDVLKYIEQEGLFLQASTDQTDELIEAALMRHAAKITEYKKGKKGLISLFVGEVMKLSGGKVDAKLVTRKITERLKN
jgi:aspartyl-tRNA(Asn)/glutamyl-tRNA(Gln) amidotransferase subunit B